MWTARGQAFLAFEAFAAGDWDETLAEAQICVEIAEEVGETYTRVIGHSVRSLILLHRNDLRGARGADPGDPKTKDEVLDDISLYWLTNTAASSGRLYWENHGASPTSATALKPAVRSPAAPGRNHVDASSWWF